MQNSESQQLAFRSFILNFEFCLLNSKLVHCISGSKALVRAIIYGLKPPDAESRRLDS